MNANSRVFVAGDRGPVGSAICRELQLRGYRNVLTRTRQELGLLNPWAVVQFLEADRPTHVFVAAAKVGGIWANNTQPASFLWENLQIQSNLIHGAWCSGLRKHYEGSRVHQAGSLGEVVPMQPRCLARLGLRQGVRRSHVAHASATRARRLRHRHQQNTHNPGMSRGGLRPRRFGLASTCRD